MPVLLPVNTTSQPHASTNTPPGPRLSARDELIMSGLVECRISLAALSLTTTGRDSGSSALATGSPVPTSLHLHSFVSAELLIS